jgi:hypothetical protein
VLPFQPLPAPAVHTPAGLSPIVPLSAPPPLSPDAARAKPTTTMVPPTDDLDDGWDMGDDDPTALADSAQAAAQADAEMQRPENTPSSSEMAGDGAPGGDGIDEPGWD